MPLSMPPLRPLLLKFITLPPPPPARAALASTLGLLCPLVAPTFWRPQSTPLLPRTRPSALRHQVVKSWQLSIAAPPSTFFSNLLANAQEAYVAVSSFAGDTSRSTYSGDLLSTVGNEDGQGSSWVGPTQLLGWPRHGLGQLLPLSDTSRSTSPKKTPIGRCDTHNLRPAGHEIVLGAKPGLLLQGNPRYFVPLINCPETGMGLIRLLPPPTLHNRIYPIHLATNSDIPTSNRVPTSPDTRLQDHERLGHISFKRMSQLNIDGITPPTSKRLKPMTCPVCITSHHRFQLRLERLDVQTDQHHLLLPTVQPNPGKTFTRIFPVRYA
jgi:hypothetical protein